jgi:hypothetical protein
MSQEREVYMIRATVGPYTGLYSNGGSKPQFSEAGKIWSTSTAVYSHILMNFPLAYREYKTEVVTMILKESSTPTTLISEKAYLNSQITRQESYAKYFMTGTIENNLIKAIMNNDVKYIEDSLVKWRLNYPANNKAIPSLMKEPEMFLTDLCIGENVSSWVEHGGFNGAPAHIKAMIVLEHSSTDNFIGNLIGGTVF